MNSCANFSLPLNPVLPGLSLNLMSPVLPEPSLPLDPVLSELSLDHISFVLPGLSLNITNFSSDHQPSEQGVRTSQKDGDIIQHATLECSRSGIHNPQVTCNPTKWQNAITSFVDNHNHVLSTTIHETASRFRKLMLEMLSDIEKYVIQGWMDSGSIYFLLKHNYPNNPIFKKDLYNAVYQFQATNNSDDSDAFQMLQMLLSWKEFDPL
ncbi:4450_t:CDS:2 [Cetraspora pellucida]|uniref:4450_t:CDS:1 n=1 Tax=Cetraspora pellucida TaxID=1433469 RepID=A0A9N9ETI3_9GLOM|nr:4450_t:CDS:2 [Cetraspora pellucida]